MKTITREFGTQDVCSLFAKEGEEVNKSNLPYLGCRFQLGVYLGDELSFAYHCFIGG